MMERENFPKEAGNFVGCLRALGPRASHFSNMVVLIV